MAVPSVLALGLRYLDLGWPLLILAASLAPLGLSLGALMLAFGLRPARAVLRLSVVAVVLLATLVVIGQTPQPVVVPRRPLLRRWRTPNTDPLLP